MKALTIWQPWASLIMAGVKSIETRSWKTDYRGPLAIHAGAKELRGDLRSEMASLLKDHGGTVGDGLAVVFGKHGLPHGYVLGTVQLVECYRIKWLEGGRPYLTLDGTYGGLEPSEADQAFGDFTPGRYAWLLANPQPCAPVPAKGKQGLWEWTP